MASTGPSPVLGAQQPEAWGGPALERATPAGSQASNLGVREAGTGEGMFSPSTEQGAAGGERRTGSGPGAERGIVRSDEEAPVLKHIV